MLINLYLANHTAIDIDVVSISVVSGSIDHSLWWLLHCYLLLFLLHFVLVSHLYEIVIVCVPQPRRRLCLKFSALERASGRVACP